jgi:Spy/CpxP family protein refolding chaperone
MKQNVLLLTVAAVVLTCGFSFNANAAAKRPLAQRGALLEKAKEKLGITDEQAAKIKSELASQKDSIADVMHRLHAARTELNDLVQKDNSSEQSIREAAAKVGAIEAEAAVLRAKLHKQINGVLTSEQQTKLKEARKNLSQVVDRIIDRVGERLGE